MSTSNRMTLNLLGEQAKVTTTDATNRARLDRLKDYLRGLPYYNFTEKGRANICQRFRVSNDELTTALSVLQSHRHSHSTPELLRIIGVAVAPATKHQAERRGRKC
jgi:hypothetical protein